MKKYQTVVNLSEVLDNKDNDSGGGKIVTNEVAIPYLDPTPENDDVSPSNTTAPNVIFINIRREENKRIILGIVISLLFIIMYFVFFF